MAGVPDHLRYRYVCPECARSVSAWHLNQVYDPPRPPVASAPHERDGFPTIELLRQNPNFLRFSIFFACMQSAVAVSGPFVAIYLLRDLHYTYIQFMCNTGASVLMQFVVLNRWGYLALHLPTEIGIGSVTLHWGSVYYGVFLCSALVRMVVAASFLPRLNEVRSVRNMTYHGLIFRVTRFSPISGIIFDVVTRVRRSAADRQNNRK